MKRMIMIAGIAAFCPMASIAQGVPLYTETDGQLDFTGDFLGDSEIATLLGGERALNTFGPPEFVAKNIRSGTAAPVWASPWEYEIIIGGDGVIENRHDDLIFDESDAQEPAEEMVFDETDADDLRDDLTFTENDAEGHGDDMTFTESDALLVPDIFAGSQPDFLQPAHGVWTIALSQSDAVGCPPGISELAMAQLVQTSTQDVIFSEPGWVPADLNPDYGSLSWTPVGTNGFQSDAYNTGPQAAGSGVSMVITMAMNARSEQQIDVWAHIRMDLAPALAAMVGGATTCLVTMKGSYTKT